MEAIFRTYPQSDRGDERTVAMERIERAKVYLEAVDIYEVQDIEAASKAIINGSAPGLNPNFIPPAPVVASEVRRQMNLRVDRGMRQKRLHPALPPPDLEKPADSRARVAAKLADGIAALQSVAADEDAEQIKRKAEAWAKTNAIFMPDMDEIEMERRLGYAVGDQEVDHGY